MAGDCPAVGTDVFTDKALVKESTIRCVLVELFKCRDKNFYKPQHEKNLTFENDNGGSISTCRFKRRQRNMGKTKSSSKT
ncbi:hypothetical protein L3Q82_019245 [Scortum barcoo]|uniref:Uncharacterized protein n=1 Tax=Scortum barcoo TaxID=214431 RepID=A0ACB8VC73_9TELE|nr:hypothetical protein L3Q82_019245 [Scortum barcoo]